MATIYYPFTVLPVSRAFFTAVLLTAIALAASVKLAYSNSVLVFTCDSLSAIKKKDSDSYL